MKKPSQEAIETFQKGLDSLAADIMAGRVVLGKGQLFHMGKPVCAMGHAICRVGEGTDGTCASYLDKLLLKTLGEDQRQEFFDARCRKWDENDLICIVQRAIDQVVQLNDLRDTKPNSIADAIVYLSHTCVRFFNTLE